MQFESPWILLALPPLLVWVWWLGRKSYAQLQPKSRWASLGLRTVIIIALVTAIARPAWRLSSDRQHVVVLVDVSRSVSADNVDSALAKIDELAQHAQEEHSGALHFSLIAFGRQPRMLINAQDEWTASDASTRELLRYQTTLLQLYGERTRRTTEGASAEELAELQQRIARIENFRNTVVGEATDVEAALRLALNCGEVGEARTIYLFTDANFNRGDWRGTLAGLGDDVTLHMVALDKPSPPEVAAADLTLPESVRINQGFTADVHLVSTVDTSATIVLYKDGYAWSEQKADLRAGANVLRMPGLYFREKGFHTIDVVVRAEQDTMLENNTVKSLVIVPGELRVLYVDSDEVYQSYLKSALELEGMQVEARPATGVPSSLDDLLGFDAMILCNVPADRLSMRQMQLIRTYVQDFGGGFIMLGGEESFGLGGYYNTPIEEILPVRMPIQKDLMRPTLAIALVIDKSGSMEGVKIELAKRAAIATADVINPRDLIAIIGFDGQSRVILELTQAGDRGTISARVASLDAGGGTFLYPAMEDAYNMLLESSARKKHVIVLSDGQTQGFGYPQLAQMMAGSGVTVSTVGIGEGADMRLLEEVAGAGAGRAYFTNDFNSIPQIFTREALRASKSMLVERLFQPIVTEDDEAIADIDEADLPPLAGYVATTPKESAKVIMIADAGDPVLAKWRFGLGRTAAFTSDTKPRWAEDWIRWPDFALFWSQLIRSIAGHDVGESLSIDVRHRQDGDGVRLTADVRDQLGKFITDRALELTMHHETRGAVALPVEREAPGIFTAHIPEITFGKSQQFAWQIPASGNPAELQPSPFGFIYSFSPEFRTLGVGHDTLEQFASLGVGEAVSVSDATLQLGSASSIVTLLLWPYLLVLAILLAPVDILVRRLG